MEKIPSIILSILVVGLIIVIGIFMVGSMGNDLFSDDLVNSSSENILTNYSETLLQTPTTSSATTPKNSWLEFDGVNDYVNTSSEIFSSSEGFTLSIWVKIDSLSSEEEVFSQGWNNRLFSVDDKTFSCIFQNGSTLVINSDSFYFPKVWNHFVCSINTTNAMIYGNGILDVTPVSVTGTYTQTEDIIKIGSRTDGGTFFNGAIDEVRIYNQSLTQSQITEIYNSGRIANSSLPSENLVLWYSFEEASGTTIYDKSGNENNGI